MKEAEETMKKIEEKLAEGEELGEKLMDMAKLARGGLYEDGELQDVKGEPVKQYRPIMYFVDKEFDNVPSTCGGDTVRKPMLAESADDCAHACDAEGIACAGFSYVELKDSKDKVCFLFSKFKSV